MLKQPDLKVLNQSLRNFTVAILDEDDQTIGTGVAVSADGRIVTCAHVVEDALGVHPCEAGEAMVKLYFPQVKPAQERLAKVIGCFPQHDDDVVLLQIVNGTMPLAPEQIAKVGECDQSDGHTFQTYGFRDGADVALVGEGKIMTVLDVPRSGKYHSGKVQLSTKHINHGMSGAAILDTDHNLVVGIISQKYFTAADAPDSDLAFGVNARVLSLEPLGLNLEPLPYPRLEAATPKLTEAEQTIIAAASNPDTFDLTRAPSVLEEWVGRDELLQQIASDYADPDVRVIGLIGFGGEGKTSLARKVLGNIMSGTYRPDAVFWWSFYEQRSSDEFFQAALAYLGGEAMATGTGSSSARAGLLAGLLEKKRCIFVLDGFEIMQHDEGDQYGLTVSTALRDFLALFASPYHRSVCIVTSRATLIDLMAHTTYRQRDVTRLSDADGLALLRQIGVQGSDIVLDRIVSEWGGHALTLSLIGSYLVERFSGDADRVDELPEPTADDNRYARVVRVLRRYDEHLSAADKAFLMIFSAFRLPVHMSALHQVFRTPTNATTLNMLLTALDDATFYAMVEGLVKRRLIRVTTDKIGELVYTAHPLIQVHYLDLLTQDTNTKETHQQIANYYKNVSTSILPSIPTLNDLVPYIEIVYHLCRAEKYDEAFTIYWESISQKDEFIPFRIGLHETEFNIMREFFPKHNLAYEPIVSKVQDKSFIINQVGMYYLRTGQLLNASSFVERGITKDINLKDWYNASRSIMTRAELYAYLGDLKQSKETIQNVLAPIKAITNNRLEIEMLSESILGWVLYLSGDIKNAGTAFNNAEQLQRRIVPSQMYLFSVRGIQYANYLRRDGHSAYARRLSEASIHHAREYRAINDMSGSYRIIGDLCADSGDANAAGLNYNEALKLAEKVQQRDILIEALLARGRWYAKYIHDVSAALNDLNEALGYAIESGYRIFEADIRVGLAWAYLRDGQKDRARDEASRAKRESVAMGYHWGQVDADEVLAEIG